jgi:GNAT superfamily N-acetyltransferase
MTSAADVRVASPFEPADVTALATLRYAWRAGEKGESGAYAPFELAFGEWWRAHAETHTAVLGSAAGEPAGMAWLGVFHRIPGPERFERTSAYIQSVYVRPTARGNGLGGRLVEAAIDHARDRGVGYIAVHPSEKSYPLYRRAGFADTSGVLELGLTEPRRP